MKIEILVPHLPESVADATISEWFKQPGDQITKDDNLADLETDKVILEVPAPEDGILKSIEQPVGATVTSGTLMAIIDTSAAEQSSPVETPSEPAETMPLSPAVRRLIAEKNLDSTQIKGSGKDGRLTKSDVLAFLEAGGAQTEAAAPVVAEPTVAPAAKATPPTPSVTPVAPAQPLDDSRPQQRVPMTRLRARIAERLLEAQRNAAMLTTFNEVSMQRIMELRQQYKEPFEKKHGIKLGFMPFFIKAAIEALKQFPAINASIDEKEIIYHGFYDIGIAVSSERGLVVPILRDVDQYDFAAIDQQIGDFATKAKNGQLSYEELSGGTFTITNGGVFGSMLSTPILNPPQSAILGMHSIKQRAVVENNEIVIRPMMYLALTYDHRIVDGSEAVRFLVTIKERLEDPTRLLLNV